MAVIPVFGFMGAAVDYARWASAKQATMEAIDGAVLAGARMLQINTNDPSGAIAVAQNYYTQTMAGRMPLAGNAITFSTVNSGSGMTASGDAAMKTTFLQIVGINSLPVLSSNATKFPIATLSGGSSLGSNLEVAMMLDITGSMCDDGVGPCTTGAKIDALKAAANNLVNIVVQSNQSVHTSRVAVVPFSTRVRVGPDNGGATLMKSLTNLDSTWSGWYKMCTASTGSGASETGGNWACTAYATQQYSNWPVLPCVTDRVADATGYDYTDRAPGTDHWLNAHDGGRMTRSWDSSDAAPANKIGLSAADPAEHWNFSPDGCADIASPNEVMALSADKLALKARLDGLEAFGSTAGALATAWSWYMLSPNWNGIWTGTSTPGPYSDLTATQANGSVKLRKVAVLMTDGGYNTVRGWKDQDQQTVSDYATQLCTNMKAQGIEIYTVGFGLNQLGSAEQTIARATLKACGNDVSHFYESLTPADLQVAFNNIALKLSTLYLTQ